MQLRDIVQHFSKYFTDDYTAEKLAEYIYTNTLSHKLKAVIFTDILRNKHSVSLVAVGYRELGDAVQLPKVEVANGDFSWLFKTVHVSLIHTDGFSHIQWLKNIQNHGFNDTALDYAKSMGGLTPNAVLVTSNNFLYLVPKFRSLLKWADFEAKQNQKYRTLIETKEKFKRIQRRAYSKTGNGENSTIFRAIMEEAGFHVYGTSSNLMPLAIKQWYQNDKLYEFRITPIDCHLVVSDKNTIQVQRQYSLDRDSLNHAEQMLRKLRLNASEVLKIADLRVNLSALTTLY